MKVIVCGGRDFDDYNFIADILDGFVWMIDEVVCGECRGADMMGAVWAADNGRWAEKFPAKWDVHGRAAGPIRNEEMANYAQGCIAFPGGRGTADMVRRAKSKGLLVIEVTPPNPPTPSNGGHI